MQNSRIYCGIDPHSSGALAYKIGNSAFVYRLDKEPKEIINALEIMRDYMDGVTICMEKCHAHPQQGVVSMFSFGEGYGKWQGMLNMCKLKFNFVEPLKWKNYYKKLYPRLSLVTANKKQYIDVAQERYPNLNLRNKYKKGSRETIKDHNKADAVLLMDYGEIFKLT